MNRPKHGLSYEFKLDIIWYKKECWFHDLEVRDEMAQLLIENSGFKEIKILN